MKDYPHGDSNHPRKTLGKRKTGDATARQAAHFSADLQRIIDVWPHLGLERKQIILELAENVERLNADRK